MAGTRAYKSDVKAAIHETAPDPREAGLIDKHTMRRFDQSRLTPVRKLSASEIRASREREQVGQSVFAMYLNVTKDTGEPMGAGDKRPAVSACKLLSLVAKKGLSAIA